MTCYTALPLVPEERRIIGLLDPDPNLEDAELAPIYLHETRCEKRVGRNLDVAPNAFFGEDRSPQSHQ
ncbi:MAG: hypothetical protein LC751_02205, partial [Actinobacteria bacterium]|nr:hypothetical protein [Actinomycetota bacterium]